MSYRIIDEQLDRDHESNCDAIVDMLLADEYQLRFFIERWVAPAGEPGKGDDDDG